MHIFESQTNIWIIETLCTNEHEIQTNSTKFTMCYYIQTKRKKTQTKLNSNRTLKISKWGQISCLKRTKKPIGPKPNPIEHLNGYA